MWVWVLPCLSASSSACDDVAANVHREAVEVVAGVEEANVGRYQPVEPCQHPERGQPLYGLAAIAQYRGGEIAISAGLVRAVDVEQAVSAVEIQNDQLVAGLLQVSSGAPAHARVVFDHEPGDRSVRAGRDGAAEQLIRSIHGDRFSGCH